jgi:hypothetical protein
VDAYGVLDFGAWSAAPRVVSVSSYAQRVFWALWGGLVPGLVLVLSAAELLKDRRPAACHCHCHGRPGGAQRADDRQSLLKDTSDPSPGLV